MLREISTLRERVGRVATAWALAAALLALATTVAALPCCLNGTCSEHFPSECEGLGGVSGYCRIGETCDASGCDASRMLPIRRLVAVKSR